jgi:hypothetical protein
METSGTFSEKEKQVWFISKVKLVQLSKWQRETILTTHIYTLLTFVFIFSNKNPVTLYRD